MALTGIRVVARVVAVLAGAFAAVYVVVTVISGQVLWLVPASPLHSSTDFVSLPLPLRIVHVVAVALGALTIATIALLVADLSGRMRRAVAFVPAVTRAAVAIAVVLAVGSWLTRIAATLAGNSGLIYPDSGDPASADPSTLPIDWALGSWTPFAPDLPLLGVAAVIGLLAWIIRSGERLQRETEGLV